MKYFKFLMLIGLMVGSGVLLFSENLDQQSYLSILYPAVMTITTLFLFRSALIDESSEVTFKPTITRLLLVGLFVFYFSKNGYFEGFDTFTFLIVLSLLALLSLALIDIKKQE